MKKKIVAVVLGAVMAMSCLALVACGSSSGDAGSSQTSSQISVYSREEGSGTRGAFVELTGIEQEVDGEKQDMTTESAAISNSTAVMMTSVAGDDAAIGYVSLGSLNSAVKAVAIDGVTPSVDTVKDGSYKIQRPFNIVLPANVSEQTQDFVDYIMSAEGQQIVEDNGYIKIDESAAAARVDTSLSGKISVAGSSSVTPVMEKLAEGYMALNENVTIEVNQSDSSTGVQMAQEGTCDLGMASRELKDTETGVTATAIAKDGVAVIVNNNNTVSELTTEQVMQIYTGAITSWGDVS